MSRILIHAPTIKEIRTLYEALLSWDFCAECKHNMRCIRNTCSGQRLGRLAVFLRHYRALVCNNEQNGMAGHSESMTGHENIAAAILLIRSRPDVERSTIRKEIVDTWQKSSDLSIANIDSLLNLATRLMFQVNCSAEAVTPRVLEHGSDHVRWRDNATICEFIDEAFQTTDDPIFANKAECAPVDIADQLSARRLVKHLKVRFVPTSNLRNHLRYDHQANTIEVFHHIALMKEHLRLTKGVSGPTALSTSETVKLGALPRQLALEVVDSIQKLLFPLTDPQSFSLLRSLVSKHSMDPDCLRFESVSIRNDSESEVPYLYFGSRLADLYEETQNPQPRGNFEKWLQRKSGARYVMLATLIGVVIAILLGIAGLAVTIVQT